MPGLILPLVEGKTGSVGAAINSCIPLNITENSFVTDEGAEWLRTGVVIDSTDGGGRFGDDLSPDSWRTCLVPFASTPITVSFDDPNPTLASNDGSRDIRNPSNPPGL